MGKNDHGNENGILSLCDEIDRLARGVKMPEGRKTKYDYPQIRMNFDKWDGTIKEFLTAYGIPSPSPLYSAYAAVGEHPPKKTNALPFELKWADLIDEIKQCPQMSAVAVSKQTGVAPGTVGYVMRRMKEQGMLCGGETRNIAALPDNFECMRCGASLGEFRILKPCHIRRLCYCPICGRTIV